jgi:hypothetical protein
VKVGVTEIGWDWTIRRRALDTWYLAGAGRWERIIGQVLALPPAYQATPGRPVYIIRTSARASVRSVHQVEGSVGSVRLLWHPGLFGVPAAGR